MAKKNFKIFPNAFSYEDLEIKLSGITSSSAYHITKARQPELFNQVSNLLPTKYFQDLKNNIESIDFIYSGSTASPYLLTLAVGRNDRFQGSEKYDIDVFNIAPESGSTASYFEHQWHHFKDENGKRVSFDIHPFIVTDEMKRKEITYATFLTASTCYQSFDEYEKEHPEIFKLHELSFKNLY
jgi:hypothetical protein